MCRACAEAWSATPSRYVTTNIQGMQTLFVCTTEYTNVAGMGSVADAKRFDQNCLDCAKNPPDQIN